MRTPIVAGNWKMHKNLEEARKLVYEARTDLAAIDGVEVVFCPPYTALSEVAALVKDTGIGVGAQNAHWETEGAFTGEISAGMLAEFCSYVILGHSERRAMFGETDERVNLKVRAALAGNLTPIVCVGETYDENQANRTGEVVTGQVRAALSGLDLEQVSSLIVAYEPVWAIGTGLAADPSGADRVIRDYIRTPVRADFGQGAAGALRVQYGGSVKPGNAGAFFSMENIDGALVGGASLNPADFIGIVRAAAGI